jgi:hypothetical protein
MALLQIVRLAEVLPERVFEWDFNHHYVSSRLLLSGENPYTTSAGPLSERLGFVYVESYQRTATYPPAFFLVFAPLALLPPQPAFWVWVGVQAISLGVILLLSQRLLRGRLSSRGWWLVCGAVLASAPIYWHLICSNAELVLAAIVLTGYSWHRDGRHSAAILAVATAGIVKLYPLILLPWFVWASDGTARIRAGRAALAAAWVLLLILGSGPGLWLDFFRYGLPLAAAHEIGYTYHSSISSLLINLGYAAYGFAPTPAAARAWWLAGIGAGLAVIALGYVACARGTNDREAEFGILCVAMLMGILSTQGHYYVFLIFPMAVAAARLRKNLTLPGVVLYGLLIVLLNQQETWATPFLARHIYLKIAANYLPLAGLVGLGIFFTNELWSRQCAMIEQ